MDKNTFEQEFKATPEEFEKMIESSKAFITMQAGQENVFGCVTVIMKNMNTKELQHQVLAIMTMPETHEQRLALMGKIGQELAKQFHSESLILVAASLSSEAWSAPQGGIMPPSKNPLRTECAIIASIAIGWQKGTMSKAEIKRNPDNSIAFEDWTDTEAGREHMPLLKPLFLEYCSAIAGHFQPQGRMGKKPDGESPLGKSLWFDN